MTALAWTKIAPRTYAAEIITPTKAHLAIIKGVDDIFFLYLDGKQLGFEQRLTDAKAWFQSAADKAAVAVR